MDVGVFVNQGTGKTEEQALHWRPKLDSSSFKIKNMYAEIKKTWTA